MDCNNCGKLKYYVRKYKSRLKYYEKKKFSKINAPRSDSKRKKILKYNNETHHRAARVEIYNSDDSNAEPSTVGFERINIAT